MTDEARPGDNEVFASQVDATTSAKALPRSGDVLVGKYRIEKVVGEGGMGVVFAARHEALDQLVAVKVLLAEAAKGEGVIERFVREAQAAAKLQSEHVARVFDAGSLDDHTPFLVMEYLEGCDLEELLKIGHEPLAVADACDYVLQALAAMAQAHAVGIVHRDLKPANLFLALRPDGSNVIKILDFGISKQLGGAGREKALTGRAVLGSPAYMPPEQLRNAKNCDARADIWSLGIVLYELLTGETPFDREGLGVGEVFAAILEKDPSPIRAKRAEVPAELEAIVFKALRRDADERWQNVGELAHALAPFGSGRWAQLVETIDSTLARSERLRFSHTPYEIRSQFPTLPEEPNTNSGKAAFVRADAHESAPESAPENAPASARRTSAAPAKRGRARLVVAAAALILGALGAVAARGVLVPGSAASPAAAAPAAMPVLPDTRAALASPAVTSAVVEPAPEGASAAIDAGAARSVVSTAGRGPRRPPRPSAQPGASGSNGNAAKGPRPKFLNQRE